MAWIVSLSLAIGDALLGWSLHLSADARLAILSLVTAAVLILLRRLVADQDRLSRVAADRRRLRELIRQARRSGDDPALARHRATLARVNGVRLSAELRLLAVCLVPIAVLTTWAARRVAYHPPTADQPIGFAVSAPLSLVGDSMHVVPADGLSAQTWIAPVGPLSGAVPPRGVARWTIQAAARPEPHRLRFRIRREEYEHPVLVGRSIYLPPIVEHGSGVSSWVELRPVRLFGVVPGLSRTWFPPWLVGYLLLTVPFTAAGRWVLRVR